jgi:hypothetical protein
MLPLPEVKLEIDSNFRSLSITEDSSSEEYSPTSPSYCPDDEGKSFEEDFKPLSLAEQIKQYQSVRPVIISPPLSKLPLVVVPPGKLTIKIPGTPTPTTPNFPPLKTETTTKSEIIASLKTQVDVKEHIERIKNSLAENGRAYKISAMERLLRHNCSYTSPTELIGNGTITDN